MELEVATPVSFGRFEMTQRYRVAERFTEDLGHRFYDDGDFSGQQFREEVLIPEVRHAIERNQPIIFDFDGVYGMPPSFVEEAFGGLRRKHPEWLADIQRLVTVEAKSSPSLWVWTKYASACLREAKPGRPRP